MSDGAQTAGGRGCIYFPWWNLSCHSDRLALAAAWSCCAITTDCCVSPAIPITYFLIWHHKSLEPLRRCLALQPKWVMSEQHQIYTYLYKKKIIKAHRSLSQLYDTAWSSMHFQHLQVFDDNWQIHNLHTHVLHLPTLKKKKKSTLWHLCVSAVKETLFSIFGKQSPRGPRQWAQWPAQTRHTLTYWSTIKHGRHDGTDDYDSKGCVLQAENLEYFFFPFLAYGVARLSWGGLVVGPCPLWRRCLQRNHLPSSCCLLTLIFDPYFESRGW